MPGFTTHYILGMKAYNNMPSGPLKFIIAKYRWLYQLGLQGPDMFFYNLPILRHRDYRNVGSYMHEHHVSQFFRCCLNNIAKIESKQQRERALAYFCGYLGHYIGDYTCHPFVYGRIGYDVANPTSHHHGLHALLENDIDALLLYKYKHKLPSQFNQAATICLNGFETQFISRFLAQCINETYYPITYKNNFRVTPRLVQRSILAMRFGCRTLADKSGKKQAGIEFVESLFLKHPLASTKIVTDKVASPKKSLNSNHEVWCNPWNQQMASTASFPDLFHRALTKCGVIYSLIDELLNGGRLTNPSSYEFLLDELGDYSYHSGLPVGD